VCFQRLEQLAMKITFKFVVPAFCLVHFLLDVTSIYCIFRELISPFKVKCDFGWKVIQRYKL